MRRIIPILIAAGLLFWLLLRRRPDQEKPVTVADSVLDDQPLMISPGVVSLGMTSPIMPTELPETPVFGVTKTPVYVPPIISYGAPVIKPPPVELPKGRPEWMGTFPLKPTTKRVVRPIMALRPGTITGGGFIS